MAQRPIEETGNLMRNSRSAWSPAACAAALLSIVVLGSCGGGSSSPGPQPTAPTPTPGPLPGRESFKVVGYSPSWTEGVRASQWDKVTHVNYAFLNPNDGQTAAAVPNHALLQSLVSAGHARGKLVLLAVGGWTEQDNRGFEAAGRDAASAAAFASSMMAIVDQFGLDGIDIDWEWPSTADGTDQRYARLMEAVCTTMHAAGKLCTTAVVATNASGIPSSTFAFVDWFNVMVYDMGAGASHSPYAGAVSAFDYWAGRGLPAAKTVLGVPFYGRGNNFSDARTYREIVAADPQAPQADQSNGYHYNGIPTLTRKVELAASRGAGIMIWELSQDTEGAASLLEAIHARISVTSERAP
jgi:GH18 family chitinase